MSGERVYEQHPYEAPAGATEIWFIRHGASAAAIPGAPFRLVDGQGDPELSASGRTQAVLVGARLAARPPAAIYVSNLRRTHETAAPLVAALGIEPFEERDLREVFLGEWEGGLFRQHVANGHRLASQIQREQRWDVIPGAEPQAVFSERVCRVVTDIAARHQGELIYVFSHGGTIGEICAQTTSSAPFAFVGPDNTSISKLVVDGEKWILRSFNDTAHLENWVDLEATITPR